MIAHLSGKLISKAPTSCVLECGGVGYEVFFTPFTSEKLAAENAALFIHTHVREDLLQLYGFFWEEERSLFRELLRVSSIGPKLALAILSGLSHEDLIKALSEKDMGRLQKIPGVGKKTAERVLMELGDRLSKLKLTPNSPLTQLPTQAPKESELESVLEHLGYQRSEIQKAVKAVRNRMSEFETEPLESLVKATLGELTRVRPS